MSHRRQNFFTLAMAQINPHVGALEENLEIMLCAAEQAGRAGADLVVFPELTITGYPPEDLLHKPRFLERLEETEQRLFERLAVLKIDVVYGSVRWSERGLLNVAVLLISGQEVGFSAKWRLPNTGVFDEQRYFVSGEASEVALFPYRGARLGITVCEDIWRAGDPLEALTSVGATLILNVSASPYHIAKGDERERVVAERVKESALPIVYVNQVGGQDELVFDGGSFAMDGSGVVVAQGRFFEEDLMLLRVQNGKRLFPTRKEPPLSPEREVYAALSLGLRDYVRKNGFKGVVLGLSGGIDSALTAVICRDALGKERVEMLMLPSRYTSQESLEDARELARREGVTLNEIWIDDLFELFKHRLSPIFVAGKSEGAGKNKGRDVTEENLQPRIRATLLMAISNKKGELLVTTGNKSEISVGYVTLYGDMAGGFSVLKDLLKAWVYRLARERNRWAVECGEKPPIPERILEKAPSAELKPNQQDTDVLPPYPLLDKILQLYVEEDLSLQEVVARGIDREMAVRVIRMVDRNEYKRRQASPGVRITRRAFGKDRRYPITNGFEVT